MAETSLTDHQKNYEDFVGIVTHAVGQSASELRGHLEAAREIETGEGFFGPFAQAAEHLKPSIIAALTRLLESAQDYEEMRAEWQKRLDDFKQSVVVTDEEVTVENGPILARALQTMENSHVSRSLYGDLVEEAEAVRQEAIKNHQRVLVRIALMVVDPARIPAEYDGPSDTYASVLELFRLMPLTPEGFFGDEEALAKIKELHAESVKRMEALLARLREREQALVGEAIEERDEREHRHRVADASLSAEERGAQHARKIDCVESLYTVVRRLTEIVQDKGDHGLVDVNSVIELAEQASALVMRVEGRLN